MRLQMASVVVIFSVYFAGPRILCVKEMSVLRTASTVSLCNLTK